MPFFIAHSGIKNERVARIISPRTLVKIPIYCALINTASSFSGTSARSGILNWINITNMELNQRNRREIIILIDMKLI